MPGTITQGNLFGAQSVVLAVPIRVDGGGTQIQVIDTGDIGMARQSVWTFTPFANYSGSISLTVGDYLRQGYQQLIAGTAGDTPQVAIYDLVQTFAREGGTAPSVGVFADPVRLQTLTPAAGVTGAVSLAAADFDADGWDDLAIGSGAGVIPRVAIYSRATQPVDRAVTVDLTLRNTFTVFTGGRPQGVTLAAGHLLGNPSAELIVGAGAGGGSAVNVFRGPDVVSSRRPEAVISYRAFAAASGADAPPIQVHLIEAPVFPDLRPVSIAGGGLSPMFAPGGKRPLARGTIIAASGRATAGGEAVVSLYSLVSGTAQRTTVSLPNPSPSGGSRGPLLVAPVGYLFNRAAKNFLAPTVLVADPVRFTVSLYSLSGAKPSPVKNIFASAPPGGTGKASYDRAAFPFGPGLTSPLRVAVKLLDSGVATSVAGGTSGMLPSRQVAYQSPYTLAFKTDAATLFNRYQRGFFTEPRRQSSLPVDFKVSGTWASRQGSWYTPDKVRQYLRGPYSATYGPDLAAFRGQAGFPKISGADAKNPVFWRESMVAAGLQFMNRGLFYQHHHIPAWWGTPAHGDADLGRSLAAYGVYSLTPAGMQTPGLDCSDFSALVVNMVTGVKIKEGVTEQATVKDGKTQWGTGIEGTADIRIDNDPKGDILSWYTLAAYYEKHGWAETYAMLNRTLQAGDLLYYGTNPPRGSDPASFVPSAPLNISTASHVTIWTGQTMRIPGQANPLVAVPLIMDSHGSNIQVGVDSRNRPTGVVEPSGPQIRPWFVPATDRRGQSYETLATFLGGSTLADQNYYYFANFTHAVRIAFPVTAK